LIDMKRYLLVAAAVLAGALAGTSAVAAAPTAINKLATTTPLARAERLHPPARQVSPILSDVLNQVNAERSARGLAPMRYDDRLTLAAQRHSVDQAGRGQISHVGADGSTVEVRVDRVGYPWRSVAENVAYGYPDAGSVMAVWMASDGHRRNILSANTELGVGLAVGADGLTYWTQVFASPG
jgi:uncharacterized protein YkwD